MPSTYTVNLGIEKPATGEQSGTWGDTTNVNFDIIDQAVNGSERVTLTSAGTSGSPNDLNIVNGSTTSSEGRNKWIEIYSASDLGGSAYVRLVPNDAEKILFIRNSLAGSQSVLLFQGTYNASNDLEIPAGVDMVVKFDGAGASATVTDVFTKLRATEITTPTLTAGTADINGGSVDGATVGAASASTGAFTTLTASTNLNIASSTTVDGVLDEDDMSSDSATKLATQQSIKAYVDSQVGTVDTLAEILANGNTSGANNLIIDNGQALTSNTINETTAGSGVTIDSVLLKDDVVNATDVETSNISANDGTAAATIANSTGNFTITNFISNSVDIGGGAIDGTNIGASSAATGAFTTLSTTSDATLGNDILMTNDSHIQWGSASSRLEGNSSGTDTLKLYTNSTENLSINGSAGGSVVVNEGSSNLDFRVESTNNANMLFVDAGTDRVGVGTNAPVGIGLTVDGGASVGTYFYGGTNNRRQLTFTSFDTASLDAGHEIAASSVSGRLLLSASSVNHLQIDAVSNTTVFNENSTDQDFRVESDSNANMLMVNGGGNRVGIGRDPTLEVLEVAGNIRLEADNAEINLKSGVTGTTGGVNWTFNTDTTDFASIKLDYDSRATTGLHVDSGYPITLDYSVSGADGLRISSSGTLQHRFNSSGATFNENSSASLDFRVESDSNANMIFVDASANAVGIGKQPDAAGNYALDVNGAIRFGDGSVVAGICYPNVVTTTRSVGSGSQWYKVYSETTSPSPRTVYLRINASGDNSSFQGDFIINLAGYNFQHSIVLTDYQYYNVAKLEEIKTVNPGSATTTEIWVRVAAISSSVGTLTAQCSDSALVSSLSAGSEPSATIGTAHLYDDSWPSNSGRISTVFSNGAEFADASVARFRRQDGARSSFINHDTGGMNIATSVVGDNLDITVAGGSLDIALGDNYEMAVNEGSSSADFRVETNDNTNMLFIDGGTNYLCIGANVNRPDSSGSLSESHAFISGKHYVYSTTDFGVWSSNSAGTKLYFRDNTDTTIGSIAYDVGLTSVTYNTTSDRRLKENIETITDGTDKLMAMNPIKHTWKAKPDVPAVHGFIAQEMQEIVPEAVSGDPDGEEMMSMDYGRITPVLVAALQDAHRKIEALEKRLSEMEAK